MTSINLLTKIGGACVLCISLNACFAPHTAYDHPDDFRNVRSSVKLNNKKELSGYLSYSNSSPYAVLHSADQGKSVKINAKDIVTIKNDLGYFENKALRSHESIHDHSRIALVKRLTDDKAFVHVYEYQEKIPNPKSALPNTIVKHYIALPVSKDNVVWDLRSDQFGKNFNQKMQELFAADKKLVAGIQQKNDKYFVKKFSLRSNNKVRVLLNLNKDYSPEASQISAAN